MRKFLSLVIMAMFAVGAWAATATFQYTGSGQAEKTVDGITITIAKGNSNTDPATNTYSGEHFRIYKDNTITIDAGTNIIESVAFTCVSNTYASNWSSDGATAGSISVSGSIVTLSSVNARTTTITHTGAATRITEAVVTYNDGASVVVAAPTFSPAAGEVEAGTSVTIIAPDAEMIIYTTDGTTPSYANEVGETYTEPIVVNEAMTIKAIAVDANENESSVATAAYTIKQEAQIQTVTLPYAETFENGFGNFYTNDVVGSDIWFTGSYNGTYYAKATSYKNNQNTEGEGWLISPYINLEGATNPQLSFEQAINKFFGTIEEEATLWVKENTANEWTQIEIEYPAKPSSGYSDFEAQTIDLSAYAGKTIQIAFKYVGHSSGSGTWEVADVEVKNVEAPVIATPVITGETPFIGSTTVTIECETEDATIYYTIDGTEPTNQSIEYTAPFELAENTTVKAIAYDANNNASLVATKEFVKTLTVATAAEYLALEDGTEFVFTGNLVVSGQAGQRLYAQDETGGVLIYGNAGQTYKFGDVIPAGFSAKKANYNGTIEMTNMSGMQAATETAELVAKEVAIADYAANQNVYVVVKNATIDGTNLIIGEETLATYNRFGVDYPTDDKAYDVYGVATIYSNAPQLHPISFVEYQEPVVESFISFTAEQANGTVSVVLEDGTPVESLVTKVAEGQKFTVTATAKQGYVVTGIEVKAGEIVITPSEEPYEGEFSAPRAEGSNEMTKTYTMPAEDVAITVTFETATGIENINMENVKAVRYYNAAGVESATPFQGVNIVVREMTDGSKSVVKVVK